MDAPSLSVCINHKNRSFYERDGALIPLFRSGYNALLGALDAARVSAEIVIADWQDERSERLGLGPWCNDVRVRVIKCTGEFTRGGGRCVAAKASRAAALCFLDADMIAVPHLFTRGMEVVASGKAFFPLYQRQAGFKSDRLTDGIGTGNAFCSRKHFDVSCGFPAKSTWGGEDTAFWRWFVDQGISVREKVPGFVHQWHPGEGPDLKATHAA